MPPGKGSFHCWLIAFRAKERAFYPSRHHGQVWARSWVLAMGSKSGQVWTINKYGFVGDYGVNRNAAV